MIEESQLIELLTDKLVEVAPKPDMRKEFAVKYSVGYAGITHVSCQERIWYAEAKKRNWEAMTIVPLCYRDGRSVIANERLSESRKQLARKSYNYYNRNGKPFEEMYTEIEEDIKPKENEKV